MTYPSGLRRDEAATVAQQFGVALEQVHRDHLISAILAALQTHADDLIFFGGTALARTYLYSGRLSEDIDLIAVTDRRSVAHAISRTIERALRVTHGRVNWTVALADTRDTEPASLITDDGVMVRVQLLSAQGYPPWPTAVHDIHQRYSDISPTRLRTPVRDSFAGWKTAAWFERHAPRDLYDLWALALAGALTTSAARAVRDAHRSRTAAGSHVLAGTGRSGLAGAAIRTDAPHHQSRGSAEDRPLGLVVRSILTLDRRDG